MTKQVLKIKKAKNVWNVYKYTRKETISLNREIRKNKNKTLMYGWVSATKTKNYLMDDMCVDWLMLYHKNKEYKDTKENTNFKPHNLLFEGGHIFEKKVYDELEKVFPNQFVVVFDSDIHKNKNVQFIKNKNNEVKKLMNEGVPIIAQAPLINISNKTYGVADLIVRSDYMKKIFHHFEEDEDINIKAPKLKMRDGLKYHYRIIDIKWTTMTLCVDGKTIRNDGLFPAYKGQLAVYTGALNSLQGYIPNYAYIMAKAWKIGTNNVNFELDNILKNNRGYSTFDRVGVVDYSTRDNNYVEETKKAVLWNQKVITEGHKWSYGDDKPTVYELYPNMNKSSSSYFDKIKEKYALQYGDPTLLWYGNTTHRKIMHSHNIFDIRDPKCSIEKLGINNDKRGSIINKIIEINKYNNKSVINPKIITNNFGNWQQETENDYYIDFETINCNLYDTKNMNIECSFYESQITFMIGIGFATNPRIKTVDILNKLTLNNVSCYINNNNNWEYVCFYMNNFDDYINDELELYQVMDKFINIRRQNKSVKLYHWTNAEKSFMMRANLRNDKIRFNMLSNKYKYTWIDMYKVFETTPIVIKGAFRFKLKQVANAFYNNGFIKTQWRDDKITDGFSAMMNAIEIYRNNKNITYYDDTYKRIIDYNEIDCKVIWEIVGYLRKHHIKN
jgi:hypothetical protein